MNLDAAIAFRIHDLVKSNQSFCHIDVAAYIAIFFPDETTAALRERCARIAAEMFHDGEMPGYRRGAKYIDNREVIYYAPAISHDFSLKGKQSMFRRIINFLFGRS